jgi:hypothetical protein
MAKEVDCFDVYELPAHWAPFIINGDSTNLEDWEVTLATAELDDIFDAGQVLVETIGEPFFSSRPTNLLGCMVYEYRAIDHSTAA